MIQETVSAVAQWMHVLFANSVLSSVVFGFVIVLARLLRRRGPAVQVALWSLVLIRLVLPPGIGHPLAAGAVLDRLMSARADAFPTGDLRGYEGALLNPPAELETPSGGIGGTAGPGLTAMASLWLAGFLAMATIHSRRLRRIRRALSDARPVNDPAVLATCEAWRRRLRVRRSVRVVTSVHRTAPFTVGVIRPLIYLPAPVVEDPICMEAAVAHEMAHVARCDALWLGLQQAVQAAYFFNPIVWIAGMQLSCAREQLCDATVVAAGRLAARDYVGGLLDVLRLELRGTGAPTMTARKRRISVRILRIFEWQGAPRPSIGTAVALATVLGLFLLPLGRGHADSASVPSSVAAGQSEAIVPGSEEIELSNPLPEGRVTWSWGPGHLDPFTHQKVSHSGIDLAATSGTPVISPGDGVVRVATDAYEPSPASGTVILIDHGDGLSTFFAHLESLAVTEGQRIQKGAVIGTVGSTGKSTGPHLHFEVRRNGEAVNPAEFVEEWN